MSVVVWDSESDCSFKSLAGMTRDQQMKVMQATVVCALVLESKDSIVPGNWQEAIKNASTHVFWRDDEVHGQDPFEELFCLFDYAEVIVAYNGLQFDFPLLRKHYGKGKGAQRRYMEHRMKTLDPMIQIARATDMPFFKLSKLLEWNSLPSKTACGLDAIKMWENGQRQKLVDYCSHDVKALAQLVHLAQLNVVSVGWLANNVHGVSSALLAQRALQPAPTDENFVLRQ